MSSSDNKIKFGLSNVHYAIATIANDGTASFATPVAIPGGVSLSMDPQGDDDPFYADNIEYWTGNRNTGYEGDLEIALVPESFETAVLGSVVDDNNVIIEDADAEAVHFALLFQFEGDKNATRHVLYNCTAKRPPVAGNTKEDTTKPETQTLNLKSAAIYNAKLEKNIVKARTKPSTTASVYDDWYTTVYQPEEEETPGQN